jgi:hypothetical protein
MAELAAYTGGSTAATAATAATAVTSTSLESSGSPLTVQSNNCVDPNTNQTSNGRDYVVADNKGECVDRC